MAWSSVQTSYGAPNSCACPKEIRAGLHTALFPLTHTQEFNCQSSLLALAAGWDGPVSLILKD